MLAATAGGSARQASASGPPDTYVAGWDAVAMQALTAAAASPTDGFVIFANVDIAVYDSVVAIEGGYEPFAVDVDVPDASPQAAVAAAAHRVLVHYLPSQAATILDPAYSASLATIPDGALKTNGVAVGESVAQLLIAKRSTDGFRATVPYTPPNPPIPGKWLPTAPTLPVGTDLPGMTPFALDSADQFRPNGPPELSSKKWAREYNEVKQIGSSTSSTRTAGADARRPLLGRAAPAPGRGRAAQVRPRPPAGHPRRGPVHGDGQRHPRRRGDRLLRREIPLRVLAADHGDPRRRHRRQRRRPSATPAGRPCFPRRRTTPSTQARTRASRPPTAWRWPSSWGRTRSTSRSRA